MIFHGYLWICMHLSWKIRCPVKFLFLISFYLPWSIHETIIKLNFGPFSHTHSNLWLFAYVLRFLANLCKINVKNFDHFCCSFAELTGFASSKIVHVGFSLNLFYILLWNLSSALTINAFQFVVSEHQSDQSCSSAQAKLWCSLQIVVGKIEMFKLAEWL